MVAEVRDLDRTRAQLDREVAQQLNGAGAGAPRTAIELRGGELHLQVDGAQRLLAGEVYVRGRQLVRIGTAPELTAAIHRGLQRRQDQRVVVPVTSEWLRLQLTARADFQRYDRRRRRSVSVDCPAHLAANIAASGEWPHFRALDAIATAPFLRTDRSVCDTTGYDALSRVYYAPSQDFPKMLQRPMREDALRALTALLEPFGEFPFATPHAKAALAAHVLTAVARHAIDLSPVFIYSAPLPGTGKTLLAGIATRIAQGVPPAIRPYVDESEEMRKVLFSALLAGDSGVMFDNVPTGTKVRSPTLCAFVTSDVYSDRRLGANDAPVLPNRTVVTLTGNNLTPSGDFARRSIIVRLDANAETVQGRDFRIANLPAYVAEHRPRLLSACLTIIRAHALAAPPAEKPLPSFEAWSRIARDPLLWLGFADPVQTQSAEADDELEPLRDAFRTIHERSGVPATFVARDIADACAKFGGDLRAAVECAGCTDATNAGKVGYWLRANRDRVAGCWKLEQAGLTHGVGRWVLKVLRDPTSDRVAKRGGIRG